VWCAVGRRCAVQQMGPTQEAENGRGIGEKGVMCARNRVSRRREARRASTVCETWHLQVLSFRAACHDDAACVSTGFS